jgi:hypothetical protein
MNKKTDLIYDNFKKYEVIWKYKKEFDTTFRHFGDSYSHRFKFPNGYGASVIKHFGSYGYEKDLFELAVLDSEDNLCYTTPIANDVIGYLTNDEVLELLERIKEI